MKAQTKKALSASTPKAPNLKVISSEDRPMNNTTAVILNNQLTFNGCSIKVVSHNNEIWFTSAELAKALGYATSRAVSKLYNQNADEFSNGMTEVSVMGTSGNLKKSVRIFSLRGAHLIAMFARTKIAKSFRKWVLDILDNETRNKNQIVEPVKYYRYDIEIAIKDNLFNKTVKFATKSDTARAMVRGFGKTLGFKIKEMTMVEEPLNLLIGVCHE